MKRTKKILALALSLVMLLLCMPFAFAEGGTVGSVTWNYDSSSKTLTFSGSGAIPDYSNPDERPWRSICSSQGCLAVVVENGVTDIGVYACYMLGTKEKGKLQSVTIADSVVTIGRSAFQNNDDLLSVSLGNKVKSIGGSAFSQCYKLKTVTGGNSVETIGSNAFYSCQALQSLTLPSCLKSIGNYAFENCYKLEGIMLPAGLNTIGNRAFFKNYKMTAVSIPNGVTSIGSQAFLCCDYLETVSIPAGVTSIGDYAFEMTENSTALKTVNFSGSETQWNSVTKGENVFGWMDNNGNHIPRPADKMPAFCFNVAYTSVSLAATVSKTIVTNTGGTVKGSGTFEKGTQVTIAAIPANGYVFDGWYGVHTVDGKLTSKQFGNATETITLTGNLTLAALFRAAVDCTITANASEGGKASGGGTYKEGKTATLTATATDGWHFVGWYNGSNKVSESANYSFTVTGNATLTAKFEKGAAPHTHVDKDNDGKCDTCKQQMTGGDHCPQCGKIHKGFFQKIVGFFHKIIYRLSHLFDKKEKTDASK